MRPLLPLPVELADFERIQFVELDRQSRKVGHAAAYHGESFSAVVSVWRHEDSDVVIEDGIGADVARQFEIDLRHVAEAEAVSAPIRRVTLLGTGPVQIEMLEARYLIDGVEDEPAFATVAACGLCRSYVTIATTVAGPDVHLTASRSKFLSALGASWAGAISSSNAPAPLRRAASVATDLAQWQELRFMA